MGTFSKIKRYSKPSREINEKIESLDQELKKTLGEAIVNSTTDVYNIFQYVDSVAEVPPTNENVPDTTGITGGNFTQPTGGGDVNNSATWNSGWQDTSYLYNSNELAGETGRPIVTSVPNPPARDAPAGGGGIVISGAFFGTSVGYIKNGNEYKQVLVGGLIGGTNQPTEASRGFGGVYRGLSDEEFNYAVGVWNAYQAAITSATVSIKAWREYNRFHDFQRGGEWETWTGGPKRTDANGRRLILDTFGIYVKPNQYQSDPGSPYQNAFTQLLNRYGLGDPNYFPGPIDLFDKLGLGQIASNVLLSSTELIKVVLNRAGYTADLLNAIPAAASTLFTYLRTNVPGAKDGQGNSIYGAHTPGNPNYKGPYVPQISNAEKQNISNTLTLAIQSANNNQGVKDINNLTSAELQHINTYMSGNIDPSAGTKNTAGQTYYNIFHNLASTKSIKQNSDGGYTITDNYRFTDNVDASVPILRPIISAVAAQNPSGSYPYIEYSQPPLGSPISAYTNKEVGRLNNMSIQVTLPPPKSVKKEDNVFEVEKFISENNSKKNNKENEDILFANLVIEYFPEYIEYLKKRYPKNDTRLSELRYKIDQMVSASEEYLETQFPENQRLFKKLQQSIKKSIKLTDPKTYKNTVDTPSFKKLLSVDYVNEVGAPKKKIKLQNRNKKTAARFLKKPKIKTGYELIQQKIIDLEKDLKKTNMI